MVSCLMFNSLSHFEFIFVYGERVCSNFIDLHLALWLSHYNFLKRLSSPLLIDHRCMDLFLASLFCPIDPYACFCISTTLF